MKEIKEFIRMMEIWHMHANNMINEKSHGEPYLLAFYNIIFSNEYEALKALVDKPISKMEVTSKMVEVARMQYIKFHNMHGVDYWMKAALEAVFASMPVSEDLTSNDCWKIEAEELALMVLESTSLARLQEVTRLNYPNLKPEQSANNTQDNDGWTLTFGEDPNLIGNPEIEVQNVCGYYIRGHLQNSEGWSWDSSVAYRIIDEPKEEKPFCAGEKCNATEEDLAHSPECMFEHFMSYTGYGINTNGGVREALKNAYFHGMDVAIKEEKKEMLIEGQREKAFNLQGKHVGYITVAHGKRYFEELKKEPQKQTLLEYKNIEFIFQSDEYLSESAYIRLKEQIEDSSLKGKVLVVEGLKVIKI